MILKTQHLNFFSICSKDESSVLITRNHIDTNFQDPGQTLDNLRSSVINSMKDNCKATNNSEKISKRLLDRDLTLFDEENTWINFRLKIRIQLLVESVSREDI